MPWNQGTSERIWVVVCSLQRGLFFAKRWDGGSEVFCLQELPGRLRWCSCDVCCSTLYLSSHSGGAIYDSQFSIVQVPLLLAQIEIVYSRGQTNTTILISHDQEILRANQLQIRIQQGEIGPKTYLRSFSHKYFGRPNFWAKFFKHCGCLSRVWATGTPPLVNT